MTREEIVKLTPIECHTIIEDILITVRSTNDSYNDLCDDLDLILLNLEIEGAHITEPNAVGVIAHELRSNIQSSKESLKKMLIRRQELIKMMELNKKFITEYEALLKEKATTNNTQI